MNSISSNFDEIERQKINQSQSLNEDFFFNYDFA